jgi:hypothetical protein
MVTILHTGLRMLQVSAMVCVGFGLLSLLEGDYAKKFANLISRRVLAVPRRKAAARSQV